jgi:hypothetical protein
MKWGREEISSRKRASLLKTSRNKQLLFTNPIHLEEGVSLET